MQKPVKTTKRQLARKSWILKKRAAKKKRKHPGYGASKWCAGPDGFQWPFPDMPGTGQHSLE